jgi:transposase
MKPYSLDLRQRVVEAYEHKEGSLRSIARRFKVSLNTVLAWVQHFRQTGSVAPKPHGGGGTPRIDAQGREKVRQLVTEQSDATLQELCERYEQQQQGVRVSQATMCRTLQKLKLSRKKKTFRASEQDRPDIQAARAAFQAEMLTLKAHQLLFLDEFGLNLALARLYARAPENQRAYAQKPLNKGQNHTGVGVLGLSGLQATAVFEGGMKGERFLSYVKEHLVPILQRGQIVFLDNLSAHKVDGVREAIEATGATLRYLPAYSPDFSPIEPCWSKVKNELRREAARTAETLREAAAGAFTTVAAQDAQGWFTHCGYCIEAT